MTHDPSSPRSDIFIESTHCMLKFFVLPAYTRSEKGFSSQEHELDLIYRPWCGTGIYERYNSHPSNRRTSPINRTRISPIPVTSINLPGDMNLTVSAGHNVAFKFTIESWVATAAHPSPIYSQIPVISRLASSAKSAWITSPTRWVVW